mgnify:CR=1 FL=1
MLTQIEATAKKNGFASLAQYDDVSMNISMIMSGIDPQSRKFTEPPEQIKREIAALKAMHGLLDFLNEAGSVGGKATFVLNNMFARDILRLRDIESADRKSVV